MPKPPYITPSDETSMYQIDFETGQLRDFRTAFKDLDGKIFYIFTDVGMED